MLDKGRIIRNSEKTLQKLQTIIDSVISFLYLETLLLNKNFICAVLNPLFNDFFFDMSYGHTIM
ncbi:MAG: hypothetical protein EAZ92_14325 [Candidatus Kapaibacterium sp.]|nr:MAG: hypothetical protein EAZ92_14325 [Candidatus Kapabacteria bacterium]